MEVIFRSHTSGYASDPRQHFAVFTTVSTLNEICQTWNYHVNFKRYEIKRVIKKGVYALQLGSKHHQSFILTMNTLPRYHFKWFNMLIGSFNHYPNNFKFNFIGKIHQAYHQAEIFRNILINNVLSKNKYLIFFER